MLAEWFSFAVSRKYKSASKESEYILSLLVHMCQFQVGGLNHHTLEAVTSPKFKAFIRKPNVYTRASVKVIREEARKHADKKKQRLNGNNKI